VFSRIGGVAGLALCACLCFAGPALAHHSFAGAFDDSKELSVTGTLSKVNWVNPHAFYEVLVPGANGASTTWIFENFPPEMLRRLGFTRTMMTDNIGKKVTVLYNPAHKQGSTYGYGRVFKFEGGKEIIFTSRGEAPSGANR
jgi:hypothetical protein